MAKSKDEYNSYMREYMLRRYHERRTKAIERLGGACVLCGASGPLEFDHIDRTTKKFCLAKRFVSAPQSVLDEEIAKCQLLCTRCHEEKSLREYQAGVANVGLAAVL
jgi:5-methylcytosine-specific restriction endonuclease McrA